MLTLVVVTMLSMAANKADPVEVARKSFNNCVIEAHNTAMKERVPVADYKAGTATRCADQRKVYWDAQVKAERRYSNQKDAEAYANDEVKIITDSNEDSYETNFESKATITPEK